MSSVKFRKLSTDRHDFAAPVIRAEATVSIASGKHSTVSQVTFCHRVDKTFLLDTSGFLESSQDGTAVRRVAAVKAVSTSSRVPLQRSRMTLHNFGQQKLPGEVQVKPQINALLMSKEQSLDTRGFELSELERCVARAMCSIVYASETSGARDSLRNRHQSGCHTTSVNGFGGTSSTRHRRTSEPPPDTPDSADRRRKSSGGQQQQSKVKAGNETEEHEELLLRPIGFHDLGRADLFVVRPTRSQTVRNSGSTMSAPPVRRRAASSGRNQQHTNHHPQGYWTLGRRN